MTAQLQLVETEPKLTSRQQAAYQAIRQSDGLYTDEVGAVAHAWSGKHQADETCEWCCQAGREVGSALRAKGLVKQRRRRLPGGGQESVWVASGHVEPGRRYPGMSDEVPY